MNEFAGPDRRRVERIALPQRCVLSLGVSIAAQVLDLSRSGVLLASRTELAVGDRGDLRVAVGDRALTVPIEVRHVVGDGASANRGRYYAGAAFTSVSPEQQRLLDEVLGVEPS